MDMSHVLHDTLIQRWLNVGPLSLTLTHHPINIGSMYIMFILVTPTIYLVMCGMPSSPSLQLICTKEHIHHRNMKWLVFRPPFCTCRLNWARRISCGREINDMTLPFRHRIRQAHYPSVTDVPHNIEYLRVCEEETYFFKLEGQSGIRALRLLHHAPPPHRPEEEWGNSFTSISAHCGSIATDRRPKLGLFTKLIEQMT